MFVITEHRPEEFEDFLAANGIKRYLARQVLHWIYKRAVFNFSGFKNLPKEVLEFLNSRCAILSGEMARRIVSDKDKTVKFLIKLPDGNIIESVLLHAGAGRLTACLSTQVGCPVSCTFCASGRTGFKRNLTTGEIISQYLLLQKEAKGREKKVDNIVFMGIGEPLLNYKNLIAAVDLLTDPAAAAMAARRITISTAGVAPAIDELSGYKKQLNLSISLHSGLDKKRDLLVPLNKKYGITALISAVKRYIAKTGRMVTFEYVLIKGINDTQLDVLALRKVLAGLRCKLNVIPYNPAETEEFKIPSFQDTQAFIKLLIKNKINAIQRQKKGLDINSGCGQLKASFFNK